MRTDNEFKDFFDNKLINVLKPLEKKRIEGLKRKKQFLKYIAVIGVSVFVCLFFSQFSVYFILLAEILAIVFCFIVSFALDHKFKTNKSLKKDFKHKIIPEILSFLYSDFEFISNQKISKTVFEKSLLFPRKVNDVRGEDYMKFWIGNASIMFCESTVFGRPPVFMQFSGIFISATFNKYFKSKTFVFPEANTPFWRKIKYKTFGKKNIVKLEDPEFEKEFIVLGENQVESRYILTPSLMSRILDYKRKLNCELSFSFVENRLYCIIPNYKDLFEPRLKASFLNYDFILESYQPVLLYTSLIEDLNLNTFIWSKN